MGHILHVELTIERGILVLGQWSHEGWLAVWVYINPDIGLELLSIFISTESKLQYKGEI